MSDCRAQAILFDLDDTLIQDVAISQRAMREVIEEAILQGTLPDGRVSLDSSDQLKEKQPKEVSSFSTQVITVSPSLEALVEQTIALSWQWWRAGPCYELCRSIGICAFETLWGHFDTPGAPWEELRNWALSFREAVFSEIVRRYDYQGCFSTQDRATLGAFMACSFMEKRRFLEKPMPGAQKLLELLHCDYKLGLVTNGAPDLQREKLAASGLAPYFSSIMISGEYGRGKPEPHIFWEALKNLGAKPEQSWMVGNSLERDIVGAKNARLRSIWIQVEGAKEPAEITPDRTIQDLAEASYFFSSSNSL